MVIYRKVANVGHIGNMVRNDFSLKTRYQDLFFIKRNLGFWLINYRSLRIKYKIYPNFNTFFYISNLMRAPRFLHKVSLHTLDWIFMVKKNRKKNC